MRWPASFDAGCRTSDPITSSPCSRRGRSVYRSRSSPPGSAARRMSRSIRPIPPNAFGPFSPTPTRRSFSCSTGASTPRSNSRSRSATPPLISWTRRPAHHWFPPPNHSPGTHAAATSPTSSIRPDRPAVPKARWWNTRVSGTTCSRKSKSWSLAPRTVSHRTRRTPSTFRSGSSSPRSPSAPPSSSIRKTSSSMAWHSCRAYRLTGSRCSKWCRRT